MATRSQVLDYGGQLTDQTIDDADSAQRRMQYRFNNQAHVPTLTGFPSANYIGQDGLDRGIGKSYDVRNLAWTRGMSRSMGTNAITTSTGMVPDTSDMMGGSSSTLKRSDLKKSYGYSDRHQNLVGMSPKLLAPSNYNLYNNITPKNSEAGRIAEAERTKGTSLAERIRRVGGTVR